MSDVAERACSTDTPSSSSLVSCGSIGTQPAEHMSPKHEREHRVSQPTKHRELELVGKSLAAARGEDIGALLDGDMSDTSLHHACTNRAVWTHIARHVLHHAEHAQLAFAAEVDLATHVNERHVLSRMSAVRGDRATPPAGS